MIRRRLLLFTLVTIVPLLSAREFRELTNTEGKKIKAELLDLKYGVVKVNINLRAYDIPLDKLSAEDQEWLKGWDMERKQGKEAAHYRREIFADDFAAEAFGERWGHYKSGSIIKEGALVGITPEGSDHPAVESIRFEGEKDLEVGLKFQFVSDKAKSFNIWFDDSKFTGSHAGHICSVSFTPKEVTIADAKTGGMENEIYRAKNLPNGMTDELQKFLETKCKRIPVALELKEWNTLVVRTRDEEASVMLNGKKIGEFQSSGIGHLTKSVVSLTTNEVDVIYDDFSIKAGGEKPKGKLTAQP